MRYTTIFLTKKFVGVLFLSLFVSLTLYANNFEKLQIAQDTVGFNQYKGLVTDSKTKKPLVFASLTVNGTNISTVTNTQGEFLLKVPKKYTNRRVTVSFLGYTSKVINLSSFQSTDNLIKLETHIEELAEVTVSFKNAENLVKEVIKRKAQNYFTDITSMTAFYRETIQKRRTYVSLAEAVVNINKQSYDNERDDALNLYKVRKSTDYEKLDTIAFKLKGGPFSPLYLDVMKYSPGFLTADMLEYYNFNFDNSTKIDNKLIYVVNFQQKSHVKDPLYFGKMYIDAETLALTSAKFNLNLDNIEQARKLFIVKKPKKAEVTPTSATYQVNYREKDGKWYYGYSRLELSFKINWDKKLFNTVYNSVIEMAVTNWEKSTTESLIKQRDRLRPSVIMVDQASGFNDPEFWGELNVIEPEKPIEAAIKKIQKQLSKLN